jgi:hypothetical protein
MPQSVEELKAENRRLKKELEICKRTIREQFLRFAKIRAHCDELESMLCKLERLAQ